MIFSSNKMYKTQSKHGHGNVTAPALTKYHGQITLYKTEKSRTNQNYRKYYSWGKIYGKIFCGYICRDDRRAKRRSNFYLMFIFVMIYLFLSAIQFVLSADEFSNLRQEERQALLHVSCTVLFSQSLDQLMSRLPCSWLQLIKMIIILIFIY